MSDGNLLVFFLVFSQTEETPHDLHSGATSPWNQDAMMAVLDQQVPRVIQRKLNHVIVVDESFEADKRGGRKEEVKVRYMFFVELVGIFFFDLVGRFIV